jgi:hypothetical protein
MRVAGFVSSLHRTPARTCSHIQHPTQLSPASLILCCQLVHGWRPSCWKLVWLFQQLLQFMQCFACRVAQHHPWLGHSFSMSYCVAYSFDLLDFRCNTVPLTRILDIMLTRHHFYRYTMQSSFIPASFMRACGAQIGSRTIVFNYHYRSRLFLSYPLLDLNFLQLTSLRLQLGVACASPASKFEWMLYIWEVSLILTGGNRRGLHRNNVGKTHWALHFI